MVTQVLRFYTEVLSRFNCTVQNHVSKYTSIYFGN